jgi:hypothetical protein
VLEGSHTHSTNVFTKYWRSRAAWRADEAGPGQTRPGPAVPSRASRGPTRSAVPVQSRSGPAAPFRSSRGPARRCRPAAVEARPGNGNVLGCRGPARRHSPGPLQGWSRQGSPRSRWRRRRRRRRRRWCSRRRRRRRQCRRWRLHRAASCIAGRHCGGQQELLRPLPARLCLVDGRDVILRALAIAKNVVQCSRREHLRSPCAHYHKNVHSKYRYVHTHYACANRFKNVHSK